MRTFVCVGSGPSLCDEDTDYLESVHNNCYIIAANRAFEKIKNPDVCYSADILWWRQYHYRVPPKSLKYSLSGVSERLSKWDIDDVLGVLWTKIRSGTHDQEIFHGGNSGQHTVDLARILGAKKIILLGFDFQHTGGKKHFHDDYPKGFINAKSPETWLEQFEYVCDYTTNHYGIDLVNCSRETAIESCRRGNLIEELSNV